MEATNINSGVSGESTSRHPVFLCFLLHRNLSVRDLQPHAVAQRDFAAQQLLAQRVLDRALNQPAQRTRAELRIVGRVDDELFCSLRQLTTQLLVGQTAVERRDLQVDDTSALRPFPDRSSAVRFQSRG